MDLGEVRGSFGFELCLVEGRFASNFFLFLLFKFLLFLVSLHARRELGFCQTLIRHLLHPFPPQSILFISFLLVHVRFAEPGHRFRLENKLLPLLHILLPRLGFSGQKPERFLNSETCQHTHLLNILSSLLVVLVDFIVQSDFQYFSGNLLGFERRRSNTVKPVGSVKRVSVLLELFLLVEKLPVLERERFRNRDLKNLRRLVRYLLLLLFIRVDDFPLGFGMGL